MKRIRFRRLFLPIRCGVKEPAPVRSQRRLLAPTFPAGEPLLFIPWRWSPRNLARRLRRLDRRRPRFRFSGIVGRGCRATMELERSSCSQQRGRAASPAGDRAGQGGSAASARSDISGWRAAALYPLAVVATESGAATSAARPAPAADFVLV